MKYYVDIDGTKHTPAEIRKDHPTIHYRIIFPQGIEKKCKVGVLWTNDMYAKTLKKAKKLLFKYNGAYIERIIQCRKLGRYTVKYILYSNKSFDQLWEEYRKLPKIILRGKKEFERLGLK